MKSTYKLLGVFWDGMPSENISAISCNEKEENTVHFSIPQLMASQSLDEVQNIIATTKRANIAIVDYDFKIQNSNKIVMAFLNKRINQITTYLKQYYDELYVEKI